jgi:hypothetical protein
MIHRSSDMGSLDALPRGENDERDNQCRNRDDRESTCHEYSRGNNPHTLIQDGLPDPFVAPQTVIVFLQLL